MRRQRAALVYRGPGAARQKGHMETDSGKQEELELECLCCKEQKEFSIARRGVGRQKAVKSSFGICLGLRRPSQAPVVPARRNCGIADSDLCRGICLEGVLEVGQRDDAAKDQTQEQDPTCGRFRRAVQALRRFLRIRRRKTRATATEGTAEPNSRPSELQTEPAVSTASSELAATCDRAAAEGRAEADMAMTEGMATSNSQTQAIPDTDTTIALTVLAMVKDILQRLASCDTVDAGLQMDILSLTERYPAHVVMILLCCAPLCDRAATLMWRAMGTSEVAAEEVLPALLSVLEKQPPCSRIFCSRDEAVFALAATLVLWRIAPMSEWHYAMLIYSPQLLVDLLFQIFTTTEQMPKNVQNFWRACRKEHGLRSNPKRFAAQTMKALLSRLGFDKKLVALEHLQVWETLLCANTQLFAASLLAREMRRGLTPLCPYMASHLLSLLIGKQPRCHLPALAFLVELLECLDLSQHGPSALWVVSRHLPSKCRDRLRLQLRGLVVLSKEPSLSGEIRGLYQHLLEQLADPDAEMVWMTLSVLTHVLQKKDLKIPSITALKLAEPLLPHFDNDNSQMQLLSIQLFSKVLELVVEEGEEPLTRIVSQSLLPLFLRWHDENLHVAKASHEALLCAARFLRRTDLEELLTKEQRMKFAQSLLLQDASRAAEHLRWALLRLQSPQRPLREAAVRIIGEPRARRPSPPPGPAAAAPPALGAAAALPQPCPPSGGSVRQGPG
ncbi:maestro heat-like repeat-containing protein family member 6 [Passer domesticus]|uniref:maestro heat-like repeat-containing protein family member 6 n=1 Tax=Passer domesticus TaxID=48849 RepID=UPI0030FF1F63